MPQNIVIRIGEVSISLVWNALRGHLVVPQAYQPFTTEGQEDISLRLHPGIPEIQLGQKVFDSAPIWSLYKNNGATLIRIFNQYPDLRRVLIMPHHFGDADLYLTQFADRRIDPFFGPVPELLMINYLARRRGVILHACGLSHDGMGILFAGESGAGKSTLAKLCSQELGAEILSDDRIIVRRHKGEFWMYGTPWHGELHFASPRDVKLKQIFFIRHGQNNAITRLSKPRSVLQFLKASFPPLWDGKGMEFTMEFLSELARDVACHEFSFRPDSSAMDVILKNTEQAY